MTSPPPLAHGQGLGDRAQAVLDRPIWGYLGAWHLLRLEGREIAHQINAMPNVAELIYGEDAGPFAPLIDYFPHTAPGPGVCQDPRRAVAVGDRASQQVPLLSVASDGDGGPIPDVSKARDEFSKSLQETENASGR